MRASIPIWILALAAASGAVRAESEMVLPPDSVTVPFESGQLAAKIDRRGQLTIGLKGTRQVVARAGLVFWPRGRKEGVEQKSLRARRVPAEIASRHGDKDGRHERRFSTRIGSIGVKGRVRVWAAGGGLVVDYLVEAEDGSAAKELAWSLRMPGTLAADGKISVRLDQARFDLGPKPTQARMSRQDAAREMVLSATVPGKDVSLAVLREAPGRMILQDLRHPALKRGTDIELLAYAAPSERPATHGLVENPAIQVKTDSTALLRVNRPVRYAFSFFLGEKPVSGAPLLVDAVDFPRKAQLFRMIESDLRILAPYATPFDPSAIDVTATVIRPSDAREKIAGYFTQHYTRRVPKQGEKGREVLTRDGEGHWRIRYVPREAGTHTIEIVAKTPGGTLRRKVRVRVAEPKKAGGSSPRPRAQRYAGFIGRSRKDARFFVDSAGRTFFPVGMNVAWPNERGTFDYDRLFEQYAKSGINAVRVWCASWWARIEGRRPNDFDLEGAWKIDRVLSSAREHGVAVFLCLDNFHDFNRNRAISACFAPNGPCRRGADFFELDAARTIYRNRLRYLTARYGAYTSLMAWELWNEMDLVELNLKAEPAPQPAAGTVLKPKARLAARRRAILAKWTAEMAAHLREIDPYGHLVGTSLSNGRVWPEVCRVVDYTAVHGYIPPPAKIRDERDFSAAAFAAKHLSAGIAGAADGLGDATQPVMIGEFGFAPLGASGAPNSRMNDLDPAGVALHNALWSGGLSGAAGAPQSWWWDNYIEDQDLGFHYEAFARFMAKEDLVSAGYWPLRIEPDPEDEDGSRVRVIGLHGRRGALLWIQNPTNTWKNRVIKDLRPKPLAGVRLNLAGLDNGHYRVEWWSTYEGKIRTNLAKTSRNGRLTLDVPTFRTDLAVKVHKIK